MFAPNAASQKVISIHALLAESDPHCADFWDDGCDISIHALLAESDQSTSFSRRSHWSFLSTLSLRRATYFGWVCGILWLISIHALLAESDERQQKLYAQLIISIHALLAESDLTVQRRTWESSYFYPRSPCGERPSRLNKWRKL